MQPLILRLGFLKISIETRSLNKKTIHLYIDFAVTSAREATQSAVQQCPMVRPIYLIEKVSTNFDLPSVGNNIL